MAAGGEAVDAKRILVSSPEHKTQKLSPYGKTLSIISIATALLVPRRSEPSYDAPASSENIHEDVKCKGLSSIKKFIAEKAAHPHLWNDVLVTWCVIATLLNSLFCYVLVVDEEKNCIGFDKKLKLTVVVMRSLLDFGYILLVVAVFWFCTCDTNNGRFGAMARRYILFTADILAVLPLPQVVILLAIPATKGSQFTIVISSLKIILIVQCLPRVLRVYSFLKKVRWSSGIYPDSAGAKAIYNLFLYMLASHVFGAFWYLFSVERKTTCLQVRCHSHPYCPRNYNNRSIGRLCMDDCSGKASSNDISAFNFGIFNDAFSSGVVYSTDFIWKLSYCFWWGLQNLSSLGQGLKTSRHIWEIYFAVFLTISGLVLFALLIGNLQTILQAKIARHEEMRLKGEDIKHWMTFQKLPSGLRERIKQYEKYKWQKTRGIDIANILNNLPIDIRRDTTRYLCFPAIKTVSTFQNKDEKFLDAVCGYLKPILYIERNSIVRKGEPLEEMIFIIQGQLWIHTSNSNGDGGTPAWSESLKEGDFFGEDLLKWAFKDPLLSTVPISTKTVSAHTKVEAFVLSAKDLKSVVFRFWWLFSQELKNDPDYRERWAPKAALVLQAAWRRHLNFKSKPEHGKSGSKIIHAIHHALKRRIRNGSNHMQGPSNNNDLPQHNDSNV